MRNYILDEDHNPILCTELLDWARWFEANSEAIIVAQITVRDQLVSTVFLGMDHSFNPHECGPILFETMVFAPDPIYCNRYHTWSEAAAGHDKVVEAVRNGHNLEELA